LVGQTLNHFPIVSQIEDMLQNYYMYFSHSPKYHIEFTKLVELMEIKILKILHNVKTWWINIFSLLIKVTARYWTLLVKMQQNSMEGEIAKENYD
jgi:hypothetical protein